MNKTPPDTTPNTPADVRGQPEPLLDLAGAWISAHECTPLPAGLPDDGFGASPDHSKTETP
jgi:hypothetical protein